MAAKRPLDEKDLRILVGVDQRETLQEIGAAILAGASFVSSRLSNLVKAGYVEKPPERKSRSLKLTDLGKQVLQANGYSKKIG